MPNTPMPSEKLQKVLANRGLGSRREIEQWIINGRVKINGKMATLGARVTPRDTLMLDGKKLAAKTDDTLDRVIVYNKPAGQICSRKDPKARDSVFDHLPPIKGSRWVMVGRLDYQTSGLLLFTTNGELAHRLMHPSYEIEREYAVRVFGALSQDSAKMLTTGVMIDGKQAKFDRLVAAGGEGRNQWFHVMLREGQNREVRKLFEHVNTTVSRLKRIRYANITLDRALKTGDHQALTHKELNLLRQKVALPAQTNTPLARRTLPSKAKRFKR